LAPIKYLLLSVLLLSGPAFAQLDGDKLDLQVEEEFDEDIVVEETPNPKPAPKTAPSEVTAEKIKAAQGARASKDAVLFDWSKHQNATEVAHPYAEKGLMRITRDKTYIYRVSESEQQTAAQIRFGAYNPENLEAPPNSDGTRSTFEENYNQTDNPAVMVDWEWQLWKSPIGKWGITAGAGAYVAQGNGHFAGNINAQEGKTPLEVFTLAVIPVNAGVTYRLQIWDKQMIVPYASGGGTIFGFGEFRDDNKAPKWGGSYGAYFAGGGALNLTYFDALSKIQLDREYGINAVYLTAEYRNIVGLSSNFDFSSNFVNGGFLLEY
jgi:hypothetical protein